jgi:hypothetical protein
MNHLKIKINKKTMMFFLIERVRKLFKIISFLDKNLNAFLWQSKSEACAYHNYIFQSSNKITTPTKIL